MKIVMNVKAIAKGGPLDGQEVECNGETHHVPVAKIGKPPTMFIYKLRERRYPDGRSKFFLLPLGATADWDEVGEKKGLLDGLTRYDKLEEEAHD